MKATKTSEELNKKKRLAYTLFVDNGFDQKVISTITEISEVSISRWKRADKEKGIDWEADRAENKQGFDKEKRRIKYHINTILDAIESRKPPHNVPTAAEGDTINKLADAAKKLQTELSFAHKAECGKQFISFIQQVHGQSKAIDVVELWHEFLMATS